MIEYIEGKLAEISPTQAVVDCHGVGYGISISLNTYSAIQHLASCKLYVYEAIREDAHLLYGFHSKKKCLEFLEKRARSADALIIIK